MTEREEWKRMGPQGLTRRAVLGAATLGGTVLAGGRVVRAASRRASPTPAAYVPRPSATQYVFAVGSASIDPDGAQSVPAVLVNGKLPGPEIRVREGDLLRILVENQLPDSPTSVHWHGLLLPAAMDGVPDVSNAPIASGRVYVYEYPIRQTGTYWYHSHFDFQEQLGCYGAFIIEPAHEPLRTDRDAVVLLGDWLHRSPAEVFAQLRGGKESKGGGMNMGGTPAGAMKMNGGGADLADVKYDAFLLNGRGPDDPWTLAVRPGERVRLRLINGAASTYFGVRLDGHPLRITHADGPAVQPVTVDHLLIGMGEVYDAVVQIGGMAPARRSVCCTRRMSHHSPIGRCRALMGAHFPTPTCALRCRPPCRRDRCARSACR
jgi:FtsP/CotA-like multicopper oxidase with cupredoxin domain